MDLASDSSVIAATLLRCVVGGFMLPHGLQKLGFIGGDRAAEAKAFNSVGLRPGQFWSALAGLLQLGFGLLLITGLFTRVAGLGTAIFMTTAGVIALRRNGWYWHDHGMEFAFFWASMGVVAALLGPGPWSLDQAF